MTQDAYWDELGLAWTAINPEIMAPRLKARLRRQTILGRLTVFGGLPLCMAGAVLGAWTLWRGATLEAWFFVTRGLAIITLSLLGGFAAWSFHAAGTDKSDSLAAMVALALRRAQARLVAIRLGLVGLGTTALLGSLGYVLRSLLALVLALLDARARTEVAKLRVLQNLLAEEPR